MAFNESIWMTVTSTVMPASADLDPVGLGAAATWRRVPVYYCSAGA